MKTEPERVNLGAYPEDLWRKNLFGFWHTHILVQKEALKQGVFHFLTTSNNRYQLLFGAH